MLIWDDKPKQVDKGFTFGEALSVVALAALFTFCAVLAMVAGN